MQVSSCRAPYKGRTRAAVLRRWRSAAVYRVPRHLRWLQPVRAARAGARKPSRSSWGLFPSGTSSFVWGAALPSLLQ